MINYKVLFKSIMQVLLGAAGIMAFVICMAIIVKTVTSEVIVGSVVGLLVAIIFIGTVVDTYKSKMRKLKDEENGSKIDS